MLYAISDLHLSLGVNKPMGKFGENWENHHEKIRGNWLRLVKESDTVIVNGDISWATKPRDFLPDAEYLSALPGRKIFALGNHDCWFSSAKRLKEQVRNSELLYKGSFSRYGDIFICGTKGWLCPDFKGFDDEDARLYEREIKRLAASLEAAVSAGAKEIYAVMHFPFMNSIEISSAFMDIIMRYPVTKAIYGHLHGDYHREGLKGEYKGVEFSLVSSDYLDFIPVLINPQSP